MSIVIKQDTTSQTACLYEEEVENTKKDQVSKEKNFDEEKDWVL